MLLGGVDKATKHKSLWYKNTIFEKQNSCQAPCNILTCVSRKRIRCVVIIRQRERLRGRRREAEHMLLMPFCGEGSTAVGSLQGISGRSLTARWSLGHLKLPQILLIYCSILLEKTKSVAFLLGRISRSVQGECGAIGEVSVEIHEGLEAGSCNGGNGEYVWRQKVGK